MNRNQLTDLLTVLCGASGISGNEDRAVQTVLPLLREYCPDARCVHGNVTGSFGSDAPDAPHVLLDAHIDQIGMIVTAVTEDGFVTAANVGGIDRRLLPAQRVMLHGTKDIPGVLCCTPPHLMDGEEQVQKWDEVRIDTGYGAAELRDILHPGDSVTFCGTAAVMPGGRFTSPAVDDRSGMAAILCALSELQGEALPCRVTVLFSAQEEVGERGAAIGGYAADPDIALAVDVSFAGDGKRSETGIAGKGPMIGYSPSLSRRVSEGLREAAEAENIPWQYEVMNSTTGTNADRFSVTRAGISACTVSIPIFYMHTPAEVVDMEDVLLTGRLIAAYLRRCRG